MRCSCVDGVGSRVLADLHASSLHGGVHFRFGVFKRRSISEAERLGCKGSIDSDLLNDLTACFSPFSIEAFGKLRGALQTVEGNKGRLPPGDLTADQVAKGSIEPQPRTKKGDAPKERGHHGTMLADDWFRSSRNRKLCPKLEIGKLAAFMLSAFFWQVRMNLFFPSTFDQTLAFFFGLVCVRKRWNSTWLKWSAWNLWRENWRDLSFLGFSAMCERDFPV